MIKKLTVLPLVFCMCFLSGCSWKEYFVVKNLSDETTSVVYEINQLKEHGFPVFNTNPRVYPLTKKNRIDWEHPIDIVDLDTNTLSVKFELAPHTIMIFGELSNDHYTNKDQYFINGREFHFSFMELTRKDNFTRITKDTFDDFFKAKEGLICYEIK